MPKKEESPEALVQTASKMLASVDELLEGGFLGAQQAKQVQKKHLEKAARTCQRAIDLKPDLLAAHRTLGSIHERAGSAVDALASLVKAMELCDGTDDLLWADSAARAYAAVCTACAKEAPRPAWWEDAALLTMSERAVALLPDASIALRWRAEVLSGGHSTLPAPAGVRSAAELREAAELYQRTARLLQSAQEKKAAIEASLACNARAIRAEKAAACGQSEAEDAAPAGDGGSCGGGGKNAAKNAKKKMKRQMKQMMAEATGVAEGQDASKRAEDATPPAVMPTPPPAPPVAPSTSSSSASASASTDDAHGAQAERARTGFQWSDPLPVGWIDRLADIGVRPGMLLDEVDLRGIVGVVGGVDSAIECGFIRRCEHDASS